MRQLTLYASTTHPGEYVLVEPSTGRIVRGPFEADPDPRRAMDSLAVDTTAPMQLEFVSEVGSIGFPPREQPDSN